VDCGAARDGLVHVSRTVPEWEARSEAVAQRGGQPGGSSGRLEGRREQRGEAEGAGWGVGQAGLWASAPKPEPRARMPKAERDPSQPEFSEGDRVSALFKDQRARHLGGCDKGAMRGKHTA